MKCRVCGKKAAVEVRRQGQAFCSEHYLEWFERQVERAIRRHRMLNEHDRVLVAVSGGKDSIALWEVLHRLGYATTGLHIQLGIDAYSQRALKATRAYAQNRGLPLIVVDLKEAYRLAIPELAELTRRRACSVCGLTKRYVMNRVAVEEGFDVVATGHNLDDEASVLLGNVLHWQTDALVRQGQRALKATRAYAQNRGLPLIVVDLKEAYRLAIPELAELTRRRACSVCGLTKRYVMNRVAVEEGFDVVATGHNLDDEASVLLGNVLHWQTDALVRQGPVLPAKTKLAKRVKPLYLLTEREILAYTLLRRLPYQHEECPFAAGAKSLLYKEALNKLESAMPGTKQAFLEQYLKKIEPILKEGLPAGEIELKACERCGYPTTGEVCAFCKTWDHAYRWARKRAVLPDETRFEPKPALAFYAKTAADGG